MAAAEKRRSAARRHRAGSIAATFRSARAISWRSETRRPVRPGSTIVISDEAPNLTDRMLGHLVGLPGIDRWIVSRVMKLGDAFTDLVERHRHAGAGH